MTSSVSVVDDLHVDGQQFEFDDVPEPEWSLGSEYDQLVGNELPCRTLVEVGVFEEAGDMLLVRDLQSLDMSEPPALHVVGRIVHPGDNGPRFLVRASVREWSIEYDEELHVTIWVSTATADYKLLSPAPPYANMWAVLQRKAALAARVTALLHDDGTLTYKAMLRQVVRCNALPDTIQFKQARSHSARKRMHTCYATRPF